MYSKVTFAYIVCFFPSLPDKRQAAKYKLDYGMLNDAGIWILKPEFISDFLTVHPKPSACNYVLDDVSDGNIEENGESSTPIKRKASDRLVQKEKRHRKWPIIL